MTYCHRRTHTWHTAYQKLLNLGKLFIVSNYKKMCSSSSYRVVGPTMNLISGNHHSYGGTHHFYERGTMHLFVVLDYWIITLKLICLSINSPSSPTLPSSPILEFEFFPIIFFFFFFHRFVLSIRFFIYIITNGLLFLLYILEISFKGSKPIKLKQLNVKKENRNK